MIEAFSCTKKYGSFTAVNNVSFTAAKGQVTGLLGRNGAGKSTLLSCICAQLYPSSGTILTGGYSVETHAEDVKRITGFAAEQPVFHSQLTVREILRCIAGIRKVTNPHQAVEKAVEQFSLEEVLKKRSDRLSKGYRQRLSFAAAVLHEPEILVLDEPVSGLDPVQSEELFTFIKSFSKKNTVLLSTHSMQEAEQLCDICHIIHEGRLVSSGSVHDICSKTKTNSLYDAFLSLTAENKS